MRRIPSCLLRHRPRCTELLRSPCLQLTARHKSDDRDGPSRKPNLHRLLFPEEYAEAAQRRIQQKKLEELSHKAVRDAAPPAPVTTADFQDETPAARKTRRIAAAKRVLILRGATRNLVRDDFLRIVPQGKNLEGWVADRTFIDAVVQERDLETLKRRGTYYLIFKTAAATAEYQKRAIRLSKLVNFHGTGSRVSERVTPPELDFKGEDVRSLIKLYTLTPYGSPLRLFQPPNELPDWLAAIADSRGQPEIVKRPGRMPAEVALRFPMSRITKAELEAALSAAEKRRNLPWCGTSFSSFKCDAWRSPASLGTELRIRTKKHRSPQSSMPINNETHTLAAALDQPVKIDEQAEPENRASVFIVGLGSRAEAESFVRYWHRRTIPEPGADPAKPPVVVDADVL